MLYVKLGLSYDTKSICLFTEKYSLIDISNNVY